MDKKDKRKDIAGKAPPHNLEAEKAVLCCIMIDANMPVQIIPMLNEEDFYAPAHRLVYKAMQTVFGKNRPVDIITLTMQLESEGKMEQVGGLEYLGALNIALPSAANFRHYVDIVKQLSTNREIIRSCNEIIEMAYYPYDEEKGKDISVLGVAEKKIYDIGESSERSALSAVQPAISQSISMMEELAKNPNSLRGIPTPFSTLNYLINGLNKGDLVVIAARPGVGKTSFGMNLIEHAALLKRRNEMGVAQGYSCAVFSLEMPVYQLATRILASVGGVSMRKMNTGALANSDWTRIFSAKKELREARIFIDDNSIITPVELLSKCRRLKREQGLDLIMIDYLQLMSSGRNRVESRTQEVSEITRLLKIAAKELEVPILLLSQLNREVEKRGKTGLRSAQLSDLRESGSIEQDADIVMFIEGDSTVVKGVRSEVSIRVAKNRNGATGAFKLIWEGECVRFLEGAASTRPIQEVQQAVPPESQSLQDEDAKSIEPSQSQDGEQG